MNPFHLTRSQLLDDLYVAYYEARCHKRNRSYQLRFEADLADSLRQLRDELWYRTYRPRPSTCFIISDPKRREVFAADFRDRIVHHLYLLAMSGTKPRCTSSLGKSSRKVCVSRS